MTMTTAVKLNDEITKVQKTIRDLNRERIELEQQLEPMNEKYEMLVGDMRFSEAEKLKNDIKALEGQIETKTDFAKSLDVQNNKHLQEVLTGEYHAYLAHREALRKEASKPLKKYKEAMKQALEAVQEVQEINRKNSSMIDDLADAGRVIGWSKKRRSLFDPFDLQNSKTNLFEHFESRTIRELLKEYLETGDIQDPAPNKIKGEK